MVIVNGEGKMISGCDGKIDKENGWRGFREIYGEGGVGTK